MNELLLISSGVLAYFCVALVAKLFGKTGLFAWIGISIILANIAVTKQVDMFGVSVTLGNIMFSSTYLATDILTEAYGHKSAENAVFMSFIAAVVFVVFGLVVNAYKPNDFDFVSEPLNNILSFSIRTTSVSIICFFLSNLADVYIFQKFRERSTKNLWFRNNVSTILCNCLENFVFTFAAFLGFYDAATCLSIALSTCIVETICGLLDTPFVYLGRKWALKELSNHE